MFNLVKKMKTSLILAAALSGAMAGADDRPRVPQVQTNLQKLYEAGTRSSVFEQVELNEGLYVVTNFGSILSEAYVLVKNNINDPNKKLVVVMPRSYKVPASGWTTNSEIGYFFQAQPWKDGRYMLTSIYVDAFGTLQVESESNRNARGIFVAWASNESISGVGHPRDFILTGVNGAVIGNRGVRMRSAEMRINPSVSPGPHNGIFSSGFSTQPAVYVNGDRLALFDEAPGNNSYRLVGINDADESMTSFATMHSTQVDMMAGTESTNTQIEKLAFFVTNCWSREVFVIARPHPSVYGAYIMKFYPYKTYILEDLLKVPLVGTVLKALFE